MPVKATLEFSQGAYSWSEAHYYLPSNSLLAAVNPANTLAVKRAAILGNYSYLNAIRLSTVPASRMVDDVIIAGGITGGFKGTGVNNDPYDSEIPNLALLVQMSAVSGPAKNLYLAGLISTLPEVQANGRQNYSLSDALSVTFLDTYLSWLTGDAFPPTGNTTSVWGYRQRVPAGASQVKQIGASQGNPSLVVLTVATLAGVVPGTEVYLTGFRRLNTQLPGLAGAYSVLDVEPTSPVGPNSLYTLAATGNVSTLNFVKPGLINTLQYTYVPYSSFQLVRICTRKRGGL